jgi:hypothetical protein
MLLALASCSSSGKVAAPSLVGEWRLVDDGGGPQEMFFDADGAFGERYEAPNGQTTCMTGTYRFEGGSLYRTQFQTEVSNVPATLDDNTLTLQGFEGAPDVIYERENSLPANRCP